MYLELFHVRLSWCNVSVRYLWGHKHAYAVSNFYLTIGNVTTGQNFVKISPYKARKKVNIYPKIWSEKSQNFLFFNQNLSVGALHNGPFGGWKQVQNCFGVNSNGATIFLIFHVSSILTFDIYFFSRFCFWRP